MKRIIDHRALACALLASTALAAPAYAQAVGPLNRNWDENGVDLVQGDYRFNFQEASIGSGNAELALVRVNNSLASSQWDLIRYRSTTSGGVVTARVTLPDGSEDVFVGATNIESNGSILTTKSNGDKVFNDGRGTQITFAAASCGTGPCELFPISIWVRGKALYTITYETAGSDHRLLTISNGSNYSIGFTYQSNTPGTAAWQTRASAQFKRDTTVVSTVGYAYPSAGVTDVTDTAGNVWRVTDTTIKRPTDASPGFSITQSGGIVSAVARDGVTTTYSRAVVGNIVTLTKTDALSNPYEVKSELAFDRVTSTKDPLNRSTVFTYDSFGRLTQVTAPEGNAIQYVLDSRGNALQTKNIPKPGSGEPTLTWATGFSSTCSGDPDLSICNQATQVTDPAGNVTSYTYGQISGQIKTVTRPAVNGLQSRISFTPYAVNPTGISECVTSSLGNCVGTADEVKTTIIYDAYGNPTSVSKGNGAGTLTATSIMTYDANGDLLTSDGPLAGTADTIRLRYDATRRQVGTIGPDPDAAGALKNRAVRATYDAAGRTTKVENGTVNSQSDPDWAAFLTIETVDVGLDANGRVTTQKLSGSAGAAALTQISYDALARPECSAIRMNPAIYASLPASACTLGTAGSFGPDRISKSVYDTAGQVTQARLAVGTADEVAEQTLTYTSNSQLQTLKDAENNLTTYEYDGHDRLKKTRFPLPTQGSNASSTTDYEQLTYDTRSNVTSRRLRDATSIAFTYDTRSRVTLKNLAGTEPDVTYGYDNLSRLTSASQTGNALSFTYDALSRNLTQVGPQGTVTSAWDLAGRRTQLTYPGAGLFVNHDYLVTGETTAIRENGAVSGIGLLATFGYDDLGRRISLTRGNGMVTSYAYDPVSRLATLTENLAGTTNDQSVTFAYNPASQIANLTKTNDLYAWTGHGSGSTASVANGLNQLATIGGAATAHDTRGNLTTDPTSGKTYGYSSENLLKTATGGVTLAYDPMLRLYDVTGAATTRFAYDRLDMIAEYDAANALQRRFVHGPGTDEPLVQYEGTGTTDRRWLHADERGSIVAISDASGNAVTINRYGEFGKPQSANAGRFQYTGQVWLPEVGLYYYKARMYAPQLGRFLQADPIDVEGGVNLYSYVGNDPVNYIDPLGLKCVAVGNHPCPVVGDDDTTVIGQRRLRSTTSAGIPMLFMRHPTGEGGSGDTRLTRAARNLACSVTSFSAGADVAFGVGPVVKGGIGLTWNQRTGQVSWYASYGVGYGVALIVGGGGSFSNGEPTAGYSTTTNAQVSVGRRLSLSHSSGSTSVGVGGGPLGVELSKTENETATGNIYVADKGAKCP